MAEQETIKVIWNGKEADAYPVKITGMDEKVQVYTLADGTTLHVRLVVTQVARVKDQYNEQTNEPVYVMRTQVVASALANPELKKK